jgi:hypothetical protein
MIFGGCVVQLSRFGVAVLLFLVLSLGLPGFVQAQSAEVDLIDVPIGNSFVATVPADWFLWTGDVYVTAEQEQRANASASIMVQSVYPSLEIPTTFARQYRQFIGVPSTPPEEGFVYMLIEVVPVADIMRVATANEAAVTTAGLLRSVNAQVLTSIAVNGRTASFGINRGTQLVSIVGAYRFPDEARLALVKIVAPEAWITNNVALVRLLVTSFRRNSESVDLVAYEEFAGEPLPATLRLPSSAPLPVPTFDFSLTSVEPEATTEAGVRVDDSGILPTPSGNVAPTEVPPTQPPAQNPPAPTNPPRPQPTPLPAVSGPVAQPVAGGQRDANGRCVPPEGWVPYIVVQGETLNSVARRFGTTFSAMRDANCIANPDLLLWGLPVYVPGTSGAAAPPPSNSGNAGNPVDTSAIPANLFAQGCTDPSTVITSPGAGARLSSSFGVFGTAYLDGMNYYKLEIRPNFSETFNFIGQSGTGVQNGQLASINPRNHGSGLFWLRLTVVDNTGNFPTPCTVPVVFQ